MTFWRRLTRDVQESRKPLRVALQRGWWLLRDERRIVAHMVEAGCEPMTGQEAYRRLS
jgi:uridine kinase